MGAGVGVQGVIVSCKAIPISRVRAPIANSWRPSAEHNSLNSHVQRHRRSLMAACCILL